MTTKLDQILEQTRHDVVARFQTANVQSLEARASAHQPRGFAATIRHVAQRSPAVIAELKKASPSKGLIRPDFHPANLAQAMQLAGAAALSILTDEPFFQGSLHNLQQASATVDIPCLRKDFIVDPFQILEARAHGADAILLIVAAHTDLNLKRLRASAREHSLDVLCEVHNAEELTRALDLDCEAIGVNSRDLRDFTVHPQILTKLVEQIPKTVVRVAESGITNGAEMARLRAAGYDAFLIGEALMRQPDPGTALAELLAAAAPSLARA